MDFGLILGLGIAVIIAGIFVYYYNKVILLSNRTDNAWSQIDVQLKKRVDLVPNLVETVKGYAKHEKAAIDSVTKARKQMMGATTPKEAAAADNLLSGALKSILALAENYPDLKANENFRLLQEQLEGIENKIAFARQFYNDSVLEYNNAVTMIPSSFIASIMNKAQREYFEIEETGREPVEVSF
ncbi:MAG: LemA family protein [Candidatus Diapherotrites archaeon]|nr:LemA family protein [Candidatus Diapherotrites archaeon]